MKTPVNKANRPTLVPSLSLDMSNVFQIDQDDEILEISQKLRESSIEMAETESDIYIPETAEEVLVDRERVKKAREEEEARVLAEVESDIYIPETPEEDLEAREAEKARSLMTINDNENVDSIAPIKSSPHDRVNASFSLDESIDDELSQRSKSLTINDDDKR